ncbi:MAG: DMT family transporter [Pseudomonadota bacterium]
MPRFSYADGDNLALAIGAVVFTVFALSLGDALIKQVSASFPLWQIFVLRSVLAIPVLLFAFKLNKQPIRFLRSSAGWVVVRSLMLTFMWVAYYSALPHVELSVAAAVYYTLPLFITLFAALFIGEKVGVQGTIAVCLGFLGILLILKPSAESFNSYALLPLVSSILYALAMILTRTKCKEDHPLSLSLALNISFIIIGLAATLLAYAFPPAAETVSQYAFLLGPWIAMGGQEWLAMGLLAVAILIGSVGAAIAYQAGPASVVSTFDFAYLAFAALWGFLFFAEVPDLITGGGIALIAVAGILAVRRQT